MLPKKFCDLFIRNVINTSSILFLKVLSKPEAGKDIAITRLVIYVKSKLYSPLLNLTFYPETNSLKKFIFCLIKKNYNNNREFIQL